MPALKKAAKKPKSKATVKKPMPTRVAPKAASKAEPKSAPKSSAKATPLKKSTVSKTTAKKTLQKAVPKTKLKANSKTISNTTSKMILKSKTVLSTTDTFRGFVPYKLKPGEEYMNPDQQTHFSDILRGWRQQLMEEVDRTVHHMQDDANVFADPNDRATQEEEFALELRTRDRERKLIKKINEALTKLDSGDYGYCEACGVEIGIRRLEARPTATLCIDCKTLDEIREKQLA